MVAAHAPHAVQAGGGPENVLLVVNANSDDSKTIANHYIALRKIPPNNVVYLDVQGNLEEGGIGTYFHDSILLPTLKAIDERRLGAQIDYIVYSSDFPWRIELKSLMPEATFTAPFDGPASITGATYLAPLLIGKNPAITLPVNWYVPGPVEPNHAQCVQLANLNSRGFRSRYLWDQNGKRVEDVKVGQRYLLSTMLGVTRGRGNTVAEVLAYLRRSANADGTRPRGTIYYMRNSDVRSTTRDKCYPQVAAEISRLGIAARVVDGTIPTSAKDVAGLMTGLQQFDFAASRSSIVPGAICEHLTSSGGMLAWYATQTPLSVFLRHGAAAASGTVIEPRAVQAKFPLPSLHLHYARGCSVAESFFQSVSAPYQLLIVGDPLCQPWAVFPNVTFTGIDAAKKISGTVMVTPAGAGAGGRPIGTFELFVDGRLVSRNPPGHTLSLDTTQLSDGYHEMRIVGIHADAIETQGRKIVPIVVNNHEATLELEIAPRPEVGLQGKLKVRVRQPGATSIVIRQNSRELGRVQGEAGELEISAATLGRGPTTLQAFSEGPAKVASSPVLVQVN
jgi:uncharacterized protein (TIGR03790 family)